MVTWSIITRLEWQPKSQQRCYRWDIFSQDFPFTHFGQFLSSFVDDLACSTKKSVGVKIHFLCLESIFFALKEGGMLITIRKSTSCNPRFVFLGLYDQSSHIQNDRLHAILHHREPRSTAELSSRLSTIHYYSSFIPAFERDATPFLFTWSSRKANLNGI